MNDDPPGAEFSARPLRPAAGGDWAFVVLPSEVSAILPRRGRCSVDGRINGQAFTARLEPDGRKSHWLRLDPPLLAAAGAAVGPTACFHLRPVAREPEPEVPDDLHQALAATPGALDTWAATTTLARVDWIHWISSAKQARTRRKRIDDACQMLAQGKKRVCCFDPSGVYSKALSAPAAAD